jgi:flagellar motor switch protein FliN/FliY
MATRPPRSMHDHQYEPLGEGTRPADHLGLEDLENVRLAIHAELGRCRMTVREVLGLREGTIVQLDKLAGEMTDIFINDQPFAKGEVVVIGDSLHVRIGEIIGTAEKAPESDD